MYTLYFKPFLDYGGISTEPVAGISCYYTCSAINVHLCIIIIVGSQWSFSTQRIAIYSCLLTELCQTMGVQVVLVVPVHQHLVISTQITVL